ncbi:DUF3240 family protein [Agitococcus lubricus]|uniref:Uncharacterized protein DUF3240 n=1 Tax=Agitococcus lubricus TaxID=1077255 RepID=A0A2T5ITF5_9GAMM|nr:DUF3240 family protein [Agitococcus lubricus]PTQ87152.1 uncharacterized protein DUF3240 [Agitococcus lubricus]HNE33663.1 DUF3240 family protein [Nitrospira sp.]HNM19792.1 DUF3240 family protein [Nitrospira sp.]
MTSCCLTLLCTPELEEKLLDLLLVDPEIKLFTSASSFTHGLHPKSLDQLEQVLGRGHSVTIQILLTQPDAEALLERLRSSISGAGIQYWLTPVLAAGELT